MNHTKLITKLSKFEKPKTSFNLTFRYIDDVLSLNNPRADPGIFGSGPPFFSNRTPLR